MSRQIATGQKKSLFMSTETHILSKQTVIQSYWRTLAYIHWEHEIQTDDEDGVSEPDSRLV